MHRHTQRSLCTAALHIYLSFSLCVCVPTFILLFFFANVWIKNNIVKTKLNWLKLTSLEFQQNKRQPSQLQSFPWIRQHLFCCFLFISSLSSYARTHTQNKKLHNALIDRSCSWLKLWFHSYLNVLFHINSKVRFPFCIHININWMSAWTSNNKLISSRARDTKGTDRIAYPHSFATNV